MTTTSANHLGESLAALTKLGQRGELFHTLSELSTWGTPVVDALAIAEGCCVDTPLGGHIHKLLVRLEQGENLPQASAKDEAPCGVRWSAVSAWAGRAAC